MSANNYALWQLGVLGINATNGFRVGSILRVSKMSGEGVSTMIAWVIANDGKSTYETQSTRGPIKYIVKVRLSPVEQGTRVEMISKINPQGVLKLAESALQMVNDTQNLSDLEQLKIILESAGKVAPKGNKGKVVA